MHPLKEPNPISSNNGHMERLIMVSDSQSAKAHRLLILFSEGAMILLLKRS